MLCMPCKFNYYNKLGDAVAHGRGGVDEVNPPPPPQVQVRNETKGLAKYGQEIVFAPFFTDYIR